MRNLPTNKENGFTLIEILTVIFIFSIIILISVSALKVFELDSLLIGVARDMTTDLRYVQQMAITEQIKYCLKLFLPEKKYQIKKCAEAQVFIEKIIPAGIISFSATGFTNNEIEFNPYGAAKESGTITLGSGSQTKIIDIRPSGFIKIN